MPGCQLWLLGSDLNVFRRPWPCFCLHWSVIQILCWWHEAGQQETVVPFLPQLGNFKQYVFLYSSHVLRLIDRVYKIILLLSIFNRRFFAEFSRLHRDGKVNFLEYKSRTLCRSDDLCFSLSTASKTQKVIFLIIPSRYLINWLTITKFH